MPITAGEPQTPVDPFATEFIQNPYPVLNWLREHEPVHRCATGAWMISRYADVSAALGDRRLGNAPAPHAIVHARNRDRYMCARVAENILPFLDAPAHTEPRKAITRVFHRHLQDTGIDMPALADYCLTPLLARRELDVIEDFATPFSLRVMTGLFGLPETDAAPLKEASDWFFYLFAIMPSDAVREQVDAGLNSFRDYFLRRIDERRRRPGTDLISALLNDEACRNFSDEMLADNCMLLFADGIENVDRAIAGTVALLADHPRHWRNLRRRPGLLPATIEECLRLESPAQFIARIAADDIELDGLRIERHSAVLLMLGSANRDPRQFAQPDVFDPGRNTENQIGFGRGRHSCIGARLVKAKMSSALGALLRHCRRLSRTRAPLIYEARLGHRWLKHLVITF